MYLLAEIFVGFGTNFVGTIMQQTIDGKEIDLRKALDNGINGAISSALPRFKRNFGRTGKYTHDIAVHSTYCFNQFLNRGSLFGNFLLWIIWPLFISGMPFYFSFHAYSVPLRPSSLPT